MIRRNKVAASAVLALCLVLLQYSVVRFASSEWPVRVVVPATIGVAPAALWVHRARIGVWVIFVGLAANLCVIVANGGLMPMERSALVAALGRERASAYETGAWISGSKDVLVEQGGGGRFLGLGDSITVHVGRGGLIASPGDVVVWSGLVILAVEASIAWQRTQRRRRLERTHHIARGTVTPTGAHDSGGRRRHANVTAPTPPPTRAGDSEGKSVADPMLASYADALTRR